MKKTLITALVICLSPAAFAAPAFIHCTASGTGLQRGEDGSEQVIISQEINAKIFYSTTKSNADLKDLPVVIGVTKIEKMEKFAVTIVEKGTRITAAAQGREETTVALSTDNVDVKVDCKIIRALN